MLATITIERWASLVHPKEPTQEKYVEWSALRIHLDHLRRSAIETHWQVVADLRSCLIATAAPAGKYRLGLDDTLTFAWDGDILHAQTIVFSGLEWTEPTREEILRRLPPGAKIHEITLVVETEKPRG